MPNLRDYQAHKVRRRMWDNGFTKAQLKSYEPRVIAVIDALCERLQEFDGSDLTQVFREVTRANVLFVGKLVDMRSWLDYVTFDVMGDLALSKSFGLLSDGSYA
jgi:cytochrome P450